MYNRPFFISLFSKLKSFLNIGENNLFFGLMNVVGESWIAVSKINSALLVVAVFSTTYLYSVPYSKSISKLKEWLWANSKFFDFISSLFLNKDTLKGPSSSVLKEKLFSFISIAKGVFIWLILKS